MERNPGKEARIGETRDRKLQETLVVELLGLWDYLVILAPKRINRIVIAVGWLDWLGIDAQGSCQDLVEKAGSWQKMALNPAPSVPPWGS